MERDLVIQLHAATELVECGEDEFFVALAISCDGEPLEILIIPQEAFDGS